MGIQISDILKEMKELGLKTPQTIPTIKIEDAKEKIEMVGKYILQGKEFVWLPQYDEIANWLTDTQGRGLLLYGQCGLGKTFLSRYVIPAVILGSCKIAVYSYDMRELNTALDLALTKKHLSIDDIGTEEQIIKYGDRRCAVTELLDASEKYGKMLILTTNLTGDELRLRYGDRVYDRILATTKRIAFSGKSFRS